MLVCSQMVCASDVDFLVEMCEDCHGKDGYSEQPDVPIIAGFSQEGFINTMAVFRANERVALAFSKPGEPETLMNDIAQDLSDDEVVELAEHFSKLPFHAADQSADAELAKIGEALHMEKCERCHKQNGAEPVEDAAILAGQWTQYLRRQFINLQSGKRTVPENMSRKVEGLSSQDIEALLNFYAMAGSG